MIVYHSKKSAFLSSFYLQTCIILEREFFDTRFLKTLEGSSCGGGAKWDIDIGEGFNPQIHYSLETKIYTYSTVMGAST